MLPMNPESMQTIIHHLVHSLVPFDSIETEHIIFTNKWISSGEPLFLIRKPATPDTHLVSYFLLIDPITNKLLLVDHKKSGLWLPAGGHVELDEHPKETVKREVVEELGVEADFLHDDPIFLTVTETVGQTAGHTDVSLWYILKGSAADSYEFDSREFKKIGWFSPQGIPYHRSDPHLKRCLHKLTSLNYLK